MVARGKNQRRQWRPTPVLLSGKSHGRRSLVGFSPWDREESDTTEQLPFHFSLSCTGEGNGNPLQCSCLENPRVGGAWWAAVYGVVQSQTRLKRLSSSSSSSKYFCIWNLIFFITEVSNIHESGENSVILQIEKLSTFCLICFTYPFFLSFILPCESESVSH